MKLSTRSRYATRMVLDIALHGPDNPVSVLDIAQRRGLPVKYLEKLIKPLRDEGIVEGKRGPGGGHVLAKPAEEITVGQIVRILEGDLLTDCSGEDEDCTNADHCLTRMIWARATQAMLRELDSVTFADLAAEARRLENHGLPCC
jgi:Rrf2 family protein